jgi:predicted nucleotidyltransferase
MMPSPADPAAVRDALAGALDSRGEIVFAVLHGSFAAGTPAPRDIDVAVWVDPSLVPDADAVRYALDLSADLTVRLGRIVDVQVLNTAPLGFRYHALAGAPLVVRNWDFYDDLRARTWDDYFDFEPFARRYLREALRA